MDNSKKNKRKVKFMVSYQRELKWLEKMAQQGWFFTNVTLGVVYSFVKGEPKRMIYDIDRFGLSKKPSLEEIRRKEMFMEMAQEMGWQEVTHDAAQNYYFCKEYQEGGVNHLHNDEESRRYRAEKFRAVAMEQGKKNVFWVLVIVVLDFLIKIYQLFVRQESLDWFHWFTLVYVIFCNAISIISWHCGVKYAKELALDQEEWERNIDPYTHKTVWKLVLTNRGLARFLGKQADQGWTLTGVTPIRYFFEKSQSAGQVYVMDSKWLVNKRREAMGEEKIEDSKDFQGINNDWEIQSVRDAEAKGWCFVCALENRSIIYKGKAGLVQPLNDARYDRRLRWISLIGEYGFYLLLSGLTGGVIGFLAELFFDI